MRFIVLAMAALLIAACGGGSSSSSPAPAASAQTGGFTVLIGDMPVDADEVNITIDEIILLGGSAGQVSLFQGTLGPINLLDLQNITELVFDGEVPADTYSKIRLGITSLEIVIDGVAELAQLPANGKIDLNPQGEFEISAGEDLVVQIDFDLDRSVHLVQTGNSRFRFRPVVFVDVLDQTDNLRLTRLFGDAVADRADSGASDFDLCEIADPDESCYDIVLGPNVLLLDAQGNVLAQDAPLTGTTSHVFGRFFTGAQGGLFFRASAVVQGAEDSIEQVSGEVSTVLASDTFGLTDDDIELTVTTQGAVLLDEMGSPLTRDPALGDAADAWGQTVVVDMAAAGEFPAFLVQFKPDDDTDEVEGRLAGVDGDQITLNGDDGELCVIYRQDTRIQRVTDDSDASEAVDISLNDLADLVGTSPEVEAFGELTGACLSADLIVVESED